MLCVCVCVSLPLTPSLLCIHAQAAAKALARGEDPEVKAEKALSAKLKAYVHVSLCDSVCDSVCNSVCLSISVRVSLCVSVSVCATLTHTTTPLPNTPLDDSYHHHHHSPLRGPDPDSMSFVRHVTPVSASTGAGIKQLWKRVCGWADQDAITSSVSDTAVREHRLARLMRHTRAVSLRSSRGGAAPGGA